MKLEDERRQGEELVSVKKHLQLPFTTFFQGSVRAMMIVDIDLHNRVVTVMHHGKLRAKLSFTHVLQLIKNGI